MEEQNKAEKKLEVEEIEREGGREGGRESGVLLDQNV